MCEPITLSSVAAWGSIAAAGISAYGMYQQGQSQKALGEYNAKVSENNAIVQQQAAEDARRRGDIAEDAQRRQTRQMLAAQRAAIGAQGGVLTDQSTEAILADTAQFGELDALTVRNNAAREAWGLEVGANNTLAQAEASRFQGQAASRAASLSAVGTLIGGVSNAYTGYRSNLRIK